MKLFSEKTRRKMSASAKARCNKEWREAQSKAKSTKLPFETVKNMYERGCSQEEIASFLNVSQKVIWRFMKNNNIRTRIACKRNQFGKNNHTWKDGRTVDEHGYVHIKTPGHPRASKCGDYVPEHVLVMEHHLGRYLKWDGPGSDQSEIVHHINGTKHDNRLENLQVVSCSEHLRIHAQMKRGDAVVKRIKNNNG